MESPVSAFALSNICPAVLSSCPARWRAPPAMPPAGGLGISSSGNPLCAAGSPGWARVTRSVIACDAGGALDLGGGSVAPVPRPAGGDLAERAVAPGLLVLGRRAAAGAPHHPRGVVPAGPFAGGGLDLGGGFPWPQVVDDLGLVQPDDALGQRVVIRVPGRPDRRRDPCARQLGAV